MKMLMGDYNFEALIACGKASVLLVESLFQEVLHMGWFR